MVFFGDTSLIMNIIWFLLFTVLIFLGPRLMLMQTMMKLDQTALMIEGYNNRAKQIVLRKISKKPSREAREKVNNFLEFFAIPPVNLDPFGIVKKIEHIEILAEKRFKYFAKKIAPKTDSETQAHIVMGLAGAVSLNQVSKVVRHFVETIRKTKNLQLAILLQMQLPMIEKISKALLKGTEAFANGWAIGDTAGSMTAAKMVGDSKMKEIEEDTLVVRKKVKGRDVIFIKAKGPGGRLGRLGKTVEKVAKRNKISKIITIDAAAKLEGEKTGSIAEGIGVAIGGLGVDRSYIEKIAVEQDIPLDSFVIKMSPEEAIMPMTIDVMKATDKIIPMLETNIAETREKGVIVIVGVGNSNGVGNNRKDAVQAEEKIKEIARIVKQREAEEEKQKGWFGF